MATTEQQRRANFRQLAAEIDADGGITTMPMRRLRDAHLDGKLGNRSVIQIANHLSKAGIGVLTRGRDLPLYQDELVQVYSEKSTVGEIVDAVLAPSDRGEQLLRKVADNDATEVVQQIKALVEEF